MPKRKKRPPPAKKMRENISADGASIEDGVPDVQPPAAKKVAASSTSLLEDDITHISSFSSVALSGTKPSSEDADMQSCHFWCNYCVFSADTKKELIIHMRQHMIKCSYCPFSSLSRAEVTKHTKCEHSDEQEVDTAIGEVDSSSSSIDCDMDKDPCTACVFCDFMTYSTEHLEKHTFKIHQGMLPKSVAKMITKQVSAKVRRADALFYLALSSDELGNDAEDAQSKLKGEASSSSEVIVIEDEKLESRKVKEEFCQIPTQPNSQPVVSSQDTQKLLMATNIVSDLPQATTQATVSSGTKQTSDWKVKVETMYCISCPYSNVAIEKLKCHSISQHPQGAAVATYQSCSSAITAQDVAFFCVKDNCTHSNILPSLYECHLMDCCTDVLSLSNLEKNRLQSTFKYLLDLQKKHNAKPAEGFFDFMSSANKVIVEEARTKCPLTSQTTNEILNRNVGYKPSAQTPTMDTKILHNSTADTAPDSRFMQGQNNVGISPKQDKNKHLDSALANHHGGQMASMVPGINSEMSNLNTLTGGFQQHPTSSLLHQGTNGMMNNEGEIMPVQSQMMNQSYNLSSMNQVGNVGPSTNQYSLNRNTPNSQSSNDGNSYGNQQDPADFTHQQAFPPQYDQNSYQASNGQIGPMGSAFQNNMPSNAGHPTNFNSSIPAGGEKNMPPSGHIQYNTSGQQLPVRVSSANQKMGNFPQTHISTPMNTDLSATHPQRTNGNGDNANSGLSQPGGMASGTLPDNVLSTTQELSTLLHEINTGDNLPRAQPNNTQNFQQPPGIFNNTLQDATQTLVPPFSQDDPPQSFMADLHEVISEPTSGSADLDIANASSQASTANVGSNEKFSSNIPPASQFPSSTMALEPQFTIADLGSGPQFTTANSASGPQFSTGQQTVQNQGYPQPSIPQVQGGMMDTQVYSGQPQAASQGQSVYTASSETQVPVEAWMDPGNGNQAEPNNPAGGVAEVVNVDQVQQFDSTQNGELDMQDMQDNMSHQSYQGSNFGALRSALNDAPSTTVAQHGHTASVPNFLVSTSSHPVNDASMGQPSSSSFLHPNMPPSPSTVRPYNPQMLHVTTPTKGSPRMGMAKSPRGNSPLSPSIYLSGPGQPRAGMPRSAVASPQQMRGRPIYRGVRQNLFMSNQQRQRGYVRTPGGRGGRMPAPPLQDPNGDDDVILTAVVRSAPNQQGPQRAMPGRGRPRGRADMMGRGRMPMPRMPGGPNLQPTRGFDITKHFEDLACVVNATGEEEDSDIQIVGVTPGKDPSKTMPRAVDASKFSFCCVHCGKDQGSKQVMKQHMKKFHNDSLLGAFRNFETGQLLFFCPQLTCEFMTYDEHRLTEHLYACYKLDKNKQLPSDLQFALKNLQSQKIRQVDVRKSKGKSHENPIDLAGQGLRDTFNNNLTDAFDGMVENPQARQMIRPGQPGQRGPPPQANRYPPAGNARPPYQPRMRNPGPAQWHGPQQGYPSSGRGSRVARGRPRMTRYPQPMNMPAGRGARMPGPQGGFNPARLGRPPRQPMPRLMTPPANTQGSNSMAPIIIDDDGPGNSPQPANASQSAPPPQGMVANDSIASVQNASFSKAPPVASDASPNGAVRLAQGQVYQNQGGALNDRQTWAVESQHQTASGSNQSFGGQVNSQNTGGFQPEPNQTSSISQSQAPGHGDSSQNTQAPPAETEDDEDKINNILLEKVFAKVPHMPKNLSQRLVLKFKQYATHKGVKITANSKVIDEFVSKISYKGSAASKNNPPSSTAVTATQRNEKNENNSNSNNSSTTQNQMSTKAFEPMSGAMNPSDQSSTLQRNETMTSANSASHGSMAADSPQTPTQTLPQNLQDNSSAPQVPSRNANQSSDVIEVGVILAQRNVTFSGAFKIANMFQQNLEKSQSVSLDAPLSETTDDKNNPEDNAVVDNHNALRKSLSSDIASKLKSQAQLKQEVDPVCSPPPSIADKKPITVNSSVDYIVSGNANLEVDIAGKPLVTGTMLSEKTLKKEIMTELEKLSDDFDKAPKGTVIDKSSSNSLGIVVDKATGKLAPKVKKNGKPRRPADFDYEKEAKGDDDSSEESEEVCIRRSERKRKILHATAAVEDDAMAELDELMSDDDDEYRMESDDDYEDDSDGPRGSSSTSKKKAKKSKGPPDPSAFDISTCNKGQFACWVCPKKFSRCTFVKKHIMKKHKEGLCAMNLENSEVDPSQIVPLLFCPRECKYVTSNLTAYDHHLDSCEKTLLAVDDLDIMEVQQHFLEEILPQLIGDNPSIKDNPTPMGPAKAEEVPNPDLLECGIDGQNHNKMLMTNGSLQKPQDDPQGPRDEDSQGPHREDSHLPGEGFHVSHQDVQHPQDNLQLRPDDLELPPEDLGVPPEDLEMPSEDLNGPPEDLEMPSEDLNGPPEDLEMPPENLQMQPEAGMQVDMQMPPEDLQVPPEDLEMPSEDLQMPPGDSELSHDDNFEMPSEGGQMPPKDLDLPPKDFPIHSKGLLPHTASEPPGEKIQLPSEHMQKETEDLPADCGHLAPASFHESSSINDLQQ